MTADAWLHIIEQHGFPIAALIIIVIWIVPKLDDVWARVFPKQKKPHLNVEELFRTDQEVSKILLEIVNKLDVGWATVWQFHNGSVTLIGVPFLKVSATHSEIKKGYQPHASLFQGMSTSLLGDLSILLTENIIRLGQTSDAYPAIAASMKSFGVRSIYAKPLFNACNTLIGVLTVSFKEDIVLGDADIDQLDAYCSRIVILLDRISKIRGCKNDDPY